MNGLELVSFVVPTFRRAEKLASTLDSILAVDHSAHRMEVVVVDDAGGDPATGLVVDGRRARSPQVQLVCQHRVSVAAARNRGAHEAHGEIIIFCDDDVLVASGHLHRHIETQRLHGPCLVSGVSEFTPSVLAALEATSFGRYRLVLEQNFEAEADAAGLGQDRFEARLLSARNLAVRRDVFWGLGGFDESFPFAGAEDQDLSLRARAAGLRLIRDHRVRVLNDEPTATLRDFCTREERSAQSFTVLVSKFPSQASRPLFAENAGSPGDPPRLVAKRAVKTVLTRKPVLTGLHGVVSILEHLPVREKGMHRIYAGLVGLHIYRGVRCSVPLSGAPRLAARVVASARRVGARVMGGRV